MNIHEIIGYFEKAYKSGENEYQCLCPAHNDKNASLGVKQLSDGRIAVAGTPAIVEFKPVRKAFNPYSVLKTVSHETLLVALASIELSKGKTLPLEDHKRLMLAAERLRQAYSLCH